MTLRATVAWSVACLAGCVITTPRSPDAAQITRIEELAAVERAFSDAATSRGVKAAFLDAMADDATLFRPGPVEGKPFFAARPEPPFRLEWRPARVAVAASGELGYSSGPWRLTPNAGPGTPLAGQFFTVWRRGDDGRWRVLIDHGAGGPPGVPASLEASALASLAGDRSRASGNVVEAEAAFAQATAADGLSAAYGAYGSANVRLLRDDAAPLDGLDGVTRMPDGDARWTWTTTDGGTSASGDLAWTMGRYRTRDAGGFFVRVWRSERGTWKILGDVLARVADTNP